jgi:hypothetical protein
MGYAMTIELNEELYRLLLQPVVAAHQTPEEWPPYESEQVHDH